jgi:hypothetical protein
VDVVLAVLAIVVALAAAARSTWSPCGQSMLSQINPIAEAGRGRRYGRTATWFVAGATLGGLSLGAVCAIGATAVDRAGVSSAAALGVVSIAATLAAVVDTRLLGFGPPFLRRQVDEDWLNRYRPWVYGGGFGWQIGVGFTTYVMTAAVPLAVVCAVCSAAPWFALAIGTMFGFARGLTVLLSARLRTQSALYDFHRRFSERGDPLRRTIIVVQLAVAVIAAWVALPTPLAVVVTTIGVALASWTSARAIHSHAPRPIANTHLATDM